MPCRRAQPSSTASGTTPLRSLSSVVTKYDPYFCASKRWRASSATFTGFPLPARIAWILLRRVLSVGVSVTLVV